MRSAGHRPESVEHHVDPADLPTDGAREQGPELLARPAGREKLGVGLDAHERVPGHSVIQRRATGCLLIGLVANL